MDALQIPELITVTSAFNADGGYSIDIDQQKSRNSSGGITAFRFFLRFPSQELPKQVYRVSPLFKMRTLSLLELP